jgi:hypothetical protein
MSDIYKEFGVDSLRDSENAGPTAAEMKMAQEITRLRDDRRERIATACLASLLTHDGWEYFTPNHAAKDAIRYADALIEEIDKEDKP